MKDITNTKQINKIKKLKKHFNKKGLQNIMQKIKQELGFILNKKSEKEELNIARKPILLAIWSIFGLLFFFVVWGCLSKIDSAAIASGVVVVDHNKKTIQHLEGGIIEKIFVKDGDKVEAGELLIKLDETSAKAQLEMFKKQMFSLQALKVRLERERDDANNGQGTLDSGQKQASSYHGNNSTLEGESMKTNGKAVKSESVGGSTEIKNQKSKGNPSLHHPTKLDSATLTQEEDYSQIVSCHSEFDSESKKNYDKLNIPNEVKNNNMVAFEDNGNSLLFNYKSFFTEDKELIKILKGEQKLYQTRKQAIDGQIDVLNQKIEQSKEQITGLEAQKKSTKQRIGFVKDEVNSVRKLYKQRIVSKTEYLDLKKQLAELEGNLGEYVASIAQVQQAIGETKIEIINTKTNWLNSIVEQLQETQNKIVDLQERLTASNDVFTRTKIVAPQSGIVTDLKFHTKGGVVPPNAPVMDIVPQDDDLVIEARVNPQDIDVVTPGLDARVRLSAYKQKNVPLINGEVILVSADSFQDQMTGQSFYKTRVKVNQEELAKLKHVKLYPGMPAETYIITSSRTFFQYLLSPVTDSMRRAFRED